MDFVKYNRGDGKYTIGSEASINSQRQTTSSSVTSTGTRSDANVWGNYFDGVADLEDTIFVNGSVYAMPSLFTEDDDDDDLPEGELEEYQEKEFERFEDDEGGNIYAQNSVKSFGNIEAKTDVYAPELYLNYPDANGNKVNILELFKYIMPVGSIIMHNGSISVTELEKYGWRVCDGSNGTPDLRGKFVRGCAFVDTHTGLYPGATGGSETKKLSVNELPAHTHSVNNLSVAYTQKIYDLSSPDTKTVGTGVTGEATTSITAYQALSVGNSTTGAYVSGSTDTEGDSEEFSILPPYYCLIYIMRVS